MVLLLLRVSVSAIIGKRNIKTLGLVSGDQTFQAKVFSQSGILCAIGAAWKC